MPAGGPPRMYGMPPPLPNQTTAISPVVGQPGGAMPGLSKIDPNQIPRPIPGSSVTLHDTRQNNQANPPPVIHLARFSFKTCISSEN